MTEFAEIPDRGHALTIDSGWAEVAQTALAFIRRFTLRPPEEFMNVTRSLAPRQAAGHHHGRCPGRLAGVTVTVSQIEPAKATTVHAADGGPKPTIVLEHGAWADASGWDPVIAAAASRRLHRLRPARPAERPGQ